MSIDNSNMSSTKPYLIRAFYEWILDNDMTPLILVDTDYEDVDVPTHYIRDGQIVLNISMTAVKELVINNDAISFDARFDGRAYNIYVPVESIVAIYTRENGKGTIFQENHEGEALNYADTKESAPKPALTATTNLNIPATKEKSKSSKSKTKSKPHLTVIK